MRRRSFSLAALLLAACAPDFEIEPQTAADAKAEVSPLPEGSGVLLASFNPDTLAPADATAAPAEPAATEYTCPHHPEVKSDKPGKCPKCGMPLEPKKAEPKDAGHDHGAHR
jgi:hypothetical protein